uniref:NADH-ubiquinone oxidoreductase chain 4L n=1 Tax=Damon diadema TaxID=317680 RepID=B5U6K8_9ARAC|nr:NADH dehydrogenase subunit 4L [Damon diadema]ACI02276.1 NADH dehydrogenase subunit 4L [Damon diadema]
MKTVFYFWWWVGFSILLLGMIGVISRWKHIFTVLVSLEMVVVGLYVLIFAGLNMGGGGVWVLLIFLGLVVCEGAVGLSLVVSLVRSHGGDCLMGFMGDVGYSF